MSKIYNTLLVLVLLSSCKINRESQTPTSSSFTLSIEQLIAKDISENKSQISTMEDEIYLFIFQTRDQQIVTKWQSPLWLFTAERDQQLFSMEFDQLESDDQLSFFLLELDNDSLSNKVIQQLENWVRSDAFPATFDQLKADNEIGHDDLLDMQSFSCATLDQNKPIIFSGLQLFDRYRYELYYKLH